MESKITQFIAKLCETKHAESQFCDVASSKIHMVSMPVPVDMFHELECIASEYNRDLPCLASDILTLALEEVIEHIPRDEKIRLDKIRHDHEIEDAERLKKERMFDAGGT